MDSNKAFKPRPAALP